MVHRIYEKKVNNTLPVLKALATGKSSATYGRAIIFKQQTESGEGDLWVAIGDASDRYWYLRMMSHAPEDAQIEAEIFFKIMALNGSIQIVTRRSKPSLQPTDPLFKRLMKILNMRVRTHLYEERGWNVPWRTDGN